MKSSILFLFLWFICVFSALSQDCDFAENSVDKFTKIRTISTKSEPIWLEGALMSRVNLEFSVGMADTFKFVRALMNCNKTSDFDWFDHFSTLWLMNETEEIIELSHHERCNYNFSGDSDWVSYWQYYLVDDSTWTMLSNFPISSIRVHMQNDHGIPYYDIEIKEKNKNILSNAITCVNVVIANDEKKKKK